MQPAMNRSHHRDTPAKHSEEGKLPPTTRQTNGAIFGEPPVRRSWRPCQMLNQDGEVNPHHHHHHRHQSHQNHLAAGRGPPRHRRRHPSSQGQGQSPVKGPGPVPVAAPDVGVSGDVAPHRGQQPRPAVARYRRHGDPSRLRGHKRYRPVSEMQDSFPGEELRDEPSAHPLTEDGGSPHQTPVAVHTSTHPADASVGHFTSPPPEAEDSGRERKNTFDQESLEVEEDEVSRDACSPTSPSSCGTDVLPTVNDRGDKQEGLVGKDCHGEADDAADAADAADADADADADAAAQTCEMSDLCSDTESAASLSMDGPLHSPPPLQSPTPPSSPDVLHFPRMDHFSEDTSLSTLPDIDMLPEDDEDGSKPSSPSLSYPKTYADFCSESYQTSEPVLQTQLEPKVHPNSAPQPVKTSSPDLHREPQKHSGWRGAPHEIQQTFTSHRREDVQQGAWSPSTRVCQSARRQGGDPGPLPSSADHSVGCRLHHYDSKSDSEGDSGSKSPVTKSHKHALNRAGTLDKSPASVQSSSSEAQEEQDQPAEDSKETGDAIFVAIKDIRNAIEEVKIKAVRSPYTPDRPEEPIWVMRQEISPTEEVQFPQTTANHVSNHDANWSFLDWKKKRFLKRQKSLNV